MRKPSLVLLWLAGLLVLAGCGAAPAARTGDASSPQPTFVFTPTPDVALHCPRLPAAQPGLAPAAPPSLYVSRDGLTALNLSDGSMRWQDAMDPNSGDWSVTVADNVVYMSTTVGNGEGTLAALNASDGRLRWCIGLQPLITSPFGGLWDKLAVDGQTVYTAGGQSGSLRAINASDGTERWNAFPAGTIVSLAAANGRVFVSATTLPSTPFNVMALDASDGQTAWSIQPQYMPVGQLTLVDGVLYTLEMGAQSNARSLDALNASDGSVRWRVPEGQSYNYGQPVVDRNMVYLADAAGVEAFSASNGARRWQGQPLGVEMVGPAAANGLVYVAWVDSNEQPLLAALDGSTGQQQWQMPLSETAPGAQISPQLRPASTMTYGKTLWGVEVLHGVVAVSYIAQTANGSADVIATFNAQTGQPGWSAQGLLLAAG